MHVQPKKHTYSTIPCSGCSGGEPLCTVGFLACSTSCFKGGEEVSRIKPSQQAEFKIAYKLALYLWVQCASCILVGTTPSYGSNLVANLVKLKRLSVKETCPGTSEFSTYQCSLVSQPLCIDSYSVPAFICTMGTRWLNVLSLACQLERCRRLNHSLVTHVVP